MLLRRAYPTAPVSDLFYDGRRQDLAFEKAAGISPKRAPSRALLAGARRKAIPARPLWLGSATFDRSVGVSRYTGQVTHHIAPDIDAERDLLTQEDTPAAGMVEGAGWVTGVGARVFARNGGGDPYFTDGEIAVSHLSPGCQTMGPSNADARSAARHHTKNRLLAG